VHLGYVDQSRDALNPNKTVWEEISGGAEVIYLDDKEINSRAYVLVLQLQGPGSSRQKVGDLSGGQRNRVHLAKVLKQGANVLLLDEPTNDLDTETLAALEDALENYAGCAVVIARSYVPRPSCHAHARL
jgi:ATPase subunit of ABC transporter with duplicated ATPase domains